MMLLIVGLLGLTRRQVVTMPSLFLALFPSGAPIMVTERIAVVFASPPRFAFMT